LPRAAALGLLVFDLFKMNEAIFARSSTPSGKTVPETPRAIRTAA
jgi:hypothetical protein